MVEADSAGNLLFFCFRFISKLVEIFMLEESGRSREDLNHQKLNKMQWVNRVSRVFFVR